jgi:hypothetical protein
MSRAIDDSGNIQNPPSSVQINGPVGSFSISGTISPTSAGSGATVTLSGPSAATVTANSSGNYTFSGLPNGNYTVTPSKSGFSFTPSSAPVSVTNANVTEINFTATSSSTGGTGIGIDATVSANSSGHNTSITSPAFSTGFGNELLLALISADVSTSSGTNNSVTSVTGGGLTWALVQRTNVQRGTAEIWRAFAAVPLNNATVTANLAISAMSSITVMSFQGVNTSGTNGSGAVGAIAGGNAASGAPTASLTTTGNGSLVLGVGFDWDGAVARTVGPNQTLFHQALVTNIGTFWMQRQSATIPSAGTLVTINDIAPTNNRYNLAICEILADLAVIPSTYAISGTISPSASGAGTTVTLSGAASATTTADASGNYTFTGLANGSYIITPSKSGFSFSPASATPTVNNANVTGVNFTIAAVPTYSISGTISPSANGTGATLTLSGATSASTTADASGNFSFSGLANGAYTVTPSKSGFTFTPANAPATVSNASVTGINFTATANSAPQTLFTTQTPSTTKRDGSSVNYELGMAFSSTSAGQITGIRFWKASSETGTHTGRIWSSSGTLLASVTFTNETASGWQQQALSAPLAIAANTTYVVSVNTGNGYYAITDSGLASQIVNGSLRSVVGTNGRFGSPGAFPTSSWQNSNYFRDVVFVP